MSSEMICYNTRQHFWVPKIDYVRTEHFLKMEERSAINIFKRHREIWVKECARLGFRQQQPPYSPHFKTFFPPLSLMHLKSCEWKVWKLQLSCKPRGMGSGMWSVDIQVSSYHRGISSNSATTRDGSSGLLSALYHDRLTASEERPQFIMKKTFVFFVAVMLISGRKYDNFFLKHYSLTPSYWRIQAKDPCADKFILCGCIKPIEGKRALEKFYV